MKKIFRCDETNEVITVESMKRDPGFSYEEVRNMSVANIAAVLSYANENSIRDAVRFIAKERKERLVRLVSIFHGRMYELIRK